MTSTHLTAAIIFASTLAACALAQANEVTDFPVSTSASTSRAAVKAEARKANDAGLLRYDFLGPREAMPMRSSKSREQVRMEATASLRSKRAPGSYDYTGGM